MPNPLKSRAPKIRELNANIGKPNFMGAISMFFIRTRTRTIKVARLTSRMNTIAGWMRTQYSDHEPKRYAGRKQPIQPSPKLIPLNQAVHRLRVPLLNHVSTNRSAQTSSLNVLLPSHANRIKAANKLSAIARRGMESPKATARSASDGEEITPANTSTEVTATNKL